MDEDEIKVGTDLDEEGPKEDELGDELDGDVLDVDPELLDGEMEV